jgi:predicted Rossmann fold flavoprotein
MAAIFAGRAGARVVALDGAARIGAKILISGGGRCNVTHDLVRADDFNGNRNAIARVLRTFDVPATIEFFAQLGVRLKREETGKLFPVTDRAKDVLEALLAAARAAGVEIVSGEKVTTVVPGESGLSINDRWLAKRVILATGGRSVPKTGSDGSGFTLARALGHTVTELFPALVPLVVESGHWITSLSGTSVEAELSVKSATGRVLERERGSMLFTHFGLSGPVVLDVSRHWIAAQRTAAAAAAGPPTLHANLLPGETFESLEAELLAASSVAGALRRRLPDRLVTTLLQESGAVAGDTPASAPVSRLTKEVRRAIVRNVVDLPLPVIRDRGFDYAEVTAGGVPLSEVDLRTMASRLCPGLYLCGEILDVDGRIGGYNFQWAWASGRLAGEGAARERAKDEG